MFQKFSNSLRFFGGFLCKRFVQKRQEAIEVIMMLVAGNLMGFYNPNQLADHLGINKTELYRRIKDWSVYQWKKMLMIVGCECALHKIRDALCKSDSTKSRRRITLSVDDTVIFRCGQLLSYTYSWWSGQHHRTVNGQNLLAITMRIGQRVIPLCIRPVGKQGRANHKTKALVLHIEKPQILKTMLSEVKDFFSEQEIDLTQFPITLS